MAGYDSVEKDLLSGMGYILNTYALNYWIDLHDQFPRDAILKEIFAHAKGSFETLSKMSINDWFKFQARYPACTHVLSMQDVKHNPDTDSKMAGAAIEMDAHGLFNFQEKPTIMAKARSILPNYVVMGSKGQGQAGSKRIENTYFKVPFGRPALMSGLPLPDPTKGPYTFVKCSFHPALRVELARNYKNSTFIDCDGTSFNSSPCTVAPGTRRSRADIPIQQAWDAMSLEERKAMYPHSNPQCPEHTYLHLKWNQLPMNVRKQLEELWERMDQLAGQMAADATMFVHDPAYPIIAVLFDKDWHAVDADQFKFQGQSRELFGRPVLGPFTYIAELDKQGKVLAVYAKEGPFLPPAHELEEIGSDARRYLGWKSPPPVGYATFNATSKVPQPYLDTDLWKAKKVQGLGISSDESRWNDTPMRRCKEELRLAGLPESYAHRAWGQIPFNDHEKMKKIVNDRIRFRSKSGYDVAGERSMVWDDISVYQRQQLLRRFGMAVMYAATPWSRLPQKIRQQLLANDT